jgi:hypothetical protein
LLPRRLPPSIAPSASGEVFSVRVNRYYGQIQFILFRLRFHLLEGIHFLYESIFWRQYRNGLPQ